MASTGESRMQPPWSPPGSGDGPPSPQLHLYNSLTRSKVPFVPQNGRTVLWYSCGPTVYDSSHMGHARSYITFDILRRVLGDYFGYGIKYCMNITDVDDKIIKRARQSYLLEEYIKKSPSDSQLVADVGAAMEVFRAKLKTETDPDKVKMMETISGKVAAAQSKESSIDTKELLAAAKDPIMAWLDSTHGADVKENEIFFALPRKFENEFHADMEALNILPPDHITRVTEFVPQIVTFIEQIISKEFAYAAGGSVYFDTGKFSQHKDHFYAKLVPEAAGNTQALQEGEGDLSLGKESLAEKKSPNDFALWKNSKPGEPSWDSPWGQGRPGWHIECSAMASLTLGDSIDIHTGGVDLKFPHHDNELAQSEAHYGHSHWIQYFLHSGHLTIEGCKMSKSLKNFITIKEALRQHSSRQLRLAFLIHSWRDTLDYSENTMKAAVQYEKTFNEFFLNVEAELRRLPSDGLGKFLQSSEAELKLDEKFAKTVDAVHERLCDSVDTRGALNHMRDMVKSVNVYLKEKEATKSLPSPALLEKVSTYVAKILTTFGVGPETKAGSSSDESKLLSSVLQAFGQFRADVRSTAMAFKNPGDLLGMCDKLRNETLPEFGVRLEDKDGHFAIKMVGKETLMKELAEEAKQQAAAEKAKEEARRKADEKLAAKNAKLKIRPEDLFKDNLEYSKFDAEGVPTHDAEGKELSKKQVKKVKKLYDTHKEAYLKRNPATGGGEAQ